MTEKVFQDLSVSATPWISRQRGHIWGTLNNCAKRQRPGSSPSSSMGCSPHSHFCEHWQLLPP